MGKAVESEGLVDLVKVLKGSAFKHVNQELRHGARLIADDCAPHIQLAVSMSRAPQGVAMSKTVRTKPDRVPVVIIGKTNPKFQHHKFKGGDTKRRRGSIAHGVIYGPKGGTNYYKIPRDDSGGALGRTLKSGPAIRAAEVAYLRLYMGVLKAYGFDTRGG